MAYADDLAIFSHSSLMNEMTAFFVDKAED